MKNDGIKLIKNHVDFLSPFHYGSKIQEWSGAGFVKVTAGDATTFVLDHLSDQWKMIVSIWYMILGPLWAISLSDQKAKDGLLQGFIQAAEGDGTTFGMDSLPVRWKRMGSSWYKDLGDSLSSLLQGSESQEWLYKVQGFIKEAEGYWTTFVLDPLPDLWKRMGSSWYRITWTLWAFTGRYQKA